MSTASLIARRTMLSTLGAACIMPLAVAPRPALAAGTNQPTKVQ